jgi:hypothetical protein
MDQITIDMAPGAIWSCTRPFAAPVGKSTDGASRYYKFKLGEQITIRSVVGTSPRSVSITGVERPTKFTTGEVWLDVVTVSEQWLYRHFGFLKNHSPRLYRLERYLQPYSVLGTDRILDDGDAMLEVGIAYQHRVDGLFIRRWENEVDTVFSLDNAFALIDLLVREGVIKGYTDEYYTDSKEFNFSHLLGDFVGCIIVDGGIDAKQCWQYGLRRTFTTLSPQRQIFIVDDDDTYIHARMTLKSGPQFVHREKKLAL